MSILSGLKKEKEEKTSDGAMVATSKTSTKDTVSSLHNIIKHPRITEKAAIVSGGGVYTFEIDTKATKIDVVRAIKAIYNVKAIKVNISTLPGKRKVVRGRQGMTSAVKKAMVYLKKGDTIEFV